MDDDSLQRRIARLPCWQKGVSLAPLQGGLTNLSYVATDGTEKFVVRCGEDIAVHHVFRDRERAASRAAHAAGLSPEVVYGEPGITVLRFVEGRTKALVVVVGILAVAAGLAVCAVRQEVEPAGVGLTRGDEHVGTAPGVERDGLPEVRPAPVGRRVHLRKLHERLQALLGRRVSPRVEAVRVEGRGQHLDLRLRRRGLGGAHVLEHVRRDQRRQNRDHHDDHQDFDQREAGATADPTAGLAARSAVNRNRTK